MIRNFNIDHVHASVRMAGFEVENGISEYHLMIRNGDGCTFEQQVESVFGALDHVCEYTLDCAVPVFLRCFISDAANQTEILQRVLPERCSCAVSIIEQPPLDGSKIALWVYLMTDVEPVCTGSGMWKAEHNGYSHLWTAYRSGRGGDSESQIKGVLDSYGTSLGAHGCTIADNCLRTWIYVQDVDVNYAGVVKGRREFFDGKGLVPQTHYIASTGIAGKNCFPDSLVTFDAYSVKGLQDAQVAYLKGATHLNPTHEYGVTFERGTSVTYGDRRHVLISGTASIDNKGQVVFPGDVCRQTMRMWENVEVLLDEAGCTFDDVVHMIVYLRDMADFKTVKEMYDERFPMCPKVFLWAPVCRPGWLVEMECMAVRPFHSETFPAL